MMHTFIQPEMLPSGIGDQVAAPAVGNLMCYYIDQGSVPCQQGGGHKGKAGVLHTPVWEGGGQQ